MKPTLNNISYTTAIALVAFSGSVSAFGMMKLVPGGAVVVCAMALLFECGKVVSFTLLHKKMPALLKLALLTVGLLLMVLNIAGVSGFLSAQYERTHIQQNATSHVAQANAYASAEIVERQLAQAESNLAQARQALVRARDDKGRVKAAQAIVTSATTERDALVRQLAAARSTKAQAEGDAIISSSEFAAIQFIAGATGASADTVAHMAIMTIASIPDVLAVLLLLAAGYTAPKTPAAPRPVRKSRRRPARRPVNLKVVNAQP
jgi:hypothetical protein